MRHSRRDLWLTLLPLILCAGCQLFEFGVTADSSESVEMPVGWGTVSELSDLELPISSIEFTPDGKRVVTSNGGHDSWAKEEGIRRCPYVPPPAKIRVWPLDDQLGWPDSHMVIRHTPGTIFDRRAFLRASDNTVIARTSVEKANDGFGIWNLETGKLVQTIKKPEQTESYGVVTSNRDSIVWPLADGMLLVHDFQTGIRHKHKIPNLGDISLMAFSADDGLLAVARRTRENGDSAGTELFVVDLRSNTIVSRFTVSGDLNFNVRFSRNGKLLAASALRDGYVHVWNVHTGRKVATLRVDGVVWSLAFSPDSRLLAVGAEVDEGEAAQAEIWKTDTWKQVARWKNKHLWGYTAMAFSPDGSTLAVGQSNGKVALVSVPEKN